MLELKNEEIDFSSLKEDIPIVFTLVRIDEDGKFVPATDDEIMEMESLVQADGDTSDANDEDDPDYTDQDDEKEDEASPMEALNLENQKRILLARIEALDSMILKVKSEDDQKTAVESTGSGYNCAKYTYKRRRRPNPKYFNVNAMDYNGGVDEQLQQSGEFQLIPTQEQSLPQLQQQHQYQQQQLQLQLQQQQQQLQQAKTEARTAAVVFDEEVLCSSSKLLSGSGGHTFINAQNNRVSLDNLSIRQLQDTFRDTFGRETSAKDKHWLKLKISRGLSSLKEVKPNHNNNNINNFINSSCNKIVDCTNVQDSMLLMNQRLDGCAEQPFVCTGGSVENMNAESGGGGDGMKVKLYPISPTASLDASTTTVVSRPTSEGQLNEVQSLEGKRQRKPNRRYLEDEMDQHRPSDDDEEAPDEDEEEEEEEEEEEDEEEEEYDQDEDSFQPDFALSWNDSMDEDDGDTEGLTGLRKRNRSLGKRAAQLVKMARNARTAKRDASNSVRKIKFKLPSVPGQENDESYELNDGDQVSCMLPTMSDDNELVPSDNEESNPRGMAKAGSRRKHHRPWTLREVVALVDGVSRCGTGKWADIKRLAFSAIAYRTPVDLKDKWRNLLRASRVHAHSSRQGEKRRKHFSVSIPAPILARVRELAAQPGQTLKLPVVRSTRSRRMMQQRK